MTNVFFSARAAALLSIFIGFLVAARAEVGVVVYESKGADARRTSTGHIALITTRLCPAGIANLRKCNQGEEPGAILTRYANLASGYTPTVFVVPLRDHFTATRDPDLVPSLSSGGTLEAMQMEYWRLHLKAYFPPLSQDQYQEMRDKLERFDAGRTFRRALTMDYLVSLLGPHKKRYATEPIAILNPVTRELVPDGRWRESIGVQHMRSSVVITASASLEQEERLLKLVDEVAPQQFNALADNCSDFVARGLTAVFGESGLRMRPRALHVADAWITTPIAVATDFVAYAKRRKVPLEVRFVPMLAGTRRPSASITSIGRGALVPDASQGKMASLMKVYFNTLNPLLGLTSFGVEKLSRFLDMQAIVHERGSEELSRLANAATLEQNTSQKELQRLRREQIKEFGTASCWQAKQEQFARLEAQAMELGVISPAERSLLLRIGQPFLLPRFYERRAALRGYEGLLNAGLPDCARPNCGSSMAFSLIADGFNLNRPSRSPAGFVPGRQEIRAMANSGDLTVKAIAFRLITSVVNYDLSSAPAARRTTEGFDADWKLYLHVTRKNGVRLDSGNSDGELVADCSCREFDAGIAITDSFQQQRSLHQKLVWEGRGLLTGANR